jgi:hypothetical protein
MPLSDSALIPRGQATEKWADIDLVQERTTDWRRWMTGRRVARSRVYELGWERRCVGPERAEDTGLRASVERTGAGYKYMMLANAGWR